MRFVKPTRRRSALNYYITQCTGNSISWGSDESEIRCGRENQHPQRLAPQAPGRAAQENGKETQLWPIEWGSIYCSSVWSPCVAHLHCVVVMILHACICVCIVGHGYTTILDVRVELNQKSNACLPRQLSIYNA